MEIKIIKNKDIQMNAEPIDKDQRTAKWRYYKVNTVYTCPRITRSVERRL